MNLTELLNQSQYNFYFLVIDNSLDINLYPQLKNFHLIYAFKPETNQLKDDKTPYICLEEQGIEIVKNSGRLLSHPKVIEYIQLTSKLNNKTPAIISFKPSAKIEFLCKKYNWVNVNNPAKLNRYFEDKLKFSSLCKNHQVPTIPSTIDILNLSNFTKYQSLYGSKLVIQTHFGWAGKSTFLAINWQDLKNIIPIDTKVKFSPYYEGFTLLNNCCLTASGLIQSPPALQFTGIKPFTQNPFTTVGRQWPSLVDPKIQDKIYIITNKFSDILKEYKYKGFFGLDFLVSQNQVYLLECNPRLTASFAFYTKIEQKNNLIPLFFYHLFEFLNIPIKLNLNQEQKRFFNPSIVGSELVFKDNQGNTIKKFNDFKKFTSTLNPIKIDSKIVKLF